MVIIHWKLRTMLPAWFLTIFLCVPIVAWAVMILVKCLTVNITEEHSKLPAHIISSLNHDYTTLDTTKSGRLCEVIHIAVICSHMREITWMLKSLLYHRQNPLHLHLIVDRASERKVQVFFDTWGLPEVQYTTYNLDNASLLANRSTVKAYDKRRSILLLPYILPGMQVVVLDADLTILCDVLELWDMFDEMSKRQFIGLVKDQRRLDAHEISKWPSMAYYNTGIMLLNLHKLQTKQWLAFWQDTLEESMKKGSIVSADECIIGTDIVYNVSCKYNVQMAEITNAKKCYGADARNVKILHWNSKKRNAEKYNLNLHRLRRSRLRWDAQYFTSVRRLYTNIEGSKLQHKLNKCSTENYTLTIDESDNCTDFLLTKTTKLLTHIYYMDYSYLPTDNDVTLVLQLSMDRLQFLNRLVGQWEGPLSVAVYVSDSQVKEFEQFVYQSDVLTRNNIAYHLVLKSHSIHYPINYLRNVALENVNTPYVFLMDVDFVPMAGLYERLKTAVIMHNPFPKKCLVVPAFQTLLREPPPRTKRDLLLQLAENIRPFKSNTWHYGHEATDYKRWVNATEPYKELNSSSHESEHQHEVDFIVRLYNVHVGFVLTN